MLSLRFGLAPSLVCNFLTPLALAVASPLVGLPCLCLAVHSLPGSVLRGARSLVLSLGCLDPWEEILCHSDTLLHGHLGPDPPFPVLLFVGRPNMQITCLFRYRPVSLFSTGAGMAAAATCSYCAAGTYYTGTGAPTAATCGLCNSGTYSTVSGATEVATCHACAAGSYFTGSGAPAANLCALCVSGTYSTASGATEAATCHACAAGTFSTASGAITADTCSQCAAGSYFTGTGAPTAATCSLCSAGTFSTGTGNENGERARIRNSERMAVPRASVSRSSRVRDDAEGLVAPSGVTLFPPWLPAFRLASRFSPALDVGLAWGAPAHVVAQ